MGHKKSKQRQLSNVDLSDELLRKIQQNTKFDENQIKKHHRAFISDCPDGLLTRKKLEFTYKTICPQGNPKSFCKAVFKAFDANKDGFINFEEFMLAMALIYSGNIEDSLKLAFQIYDVDGNGFLSLKEIEQSLRAINDLKQDVGAINDKNIRQISVRIMEYCDASKDNQISIDEFIAACKDNNIILSLNSESF